MLVKTTNDFFYIMFMLTSGVHNGPQDCLYLLVYYTIEWQPFPFALMDLGLKVYAFLTQESVFFQSSNLC